jgi:hypothetical protein
MIQFARASSIPLVWLLSTILVGSSTDAFARSSHSHPMLAPTAPARGHERGESDTQAGGDLNAEPARSPEPEAPPVGCPVTVAGPTDVVRRNGKPRGAEFVFASPDPEASHHLRIDNGGMYGERRPVTSAVVQLNGRLILGPNRFNGRTRAIEEPIDVESENQLLVWLAGKPGSGFTFEVLAIDSQPPEFVEVFPADGSVVSEPQVTLIITLDDPLAGTAFVRCAGIDATPTEGDFACTVPLAVGPNPIEVIATDACENESSEVVTIQFDPPPMVVITSPDDGDVIIHGPVVVTGTVDDPAASVAVNDVPASGAPVFTATVPVRKGDNTLVAVARDAVGGEGTDSVDITVLAGSTGPTVSITAPEPGFLLGGPRTVPATPTQVDVVGRIRAEGGAGAASTPTVIVNGNAATVTLSNVPSMLCSLLGVCNWNFEASLALSKADNPHVIEAVGTDRFGQTDADSVTGNIDECIDPVDRDGDGLADALADGNAILGTAESQSNLCHSIDGCSAPPELVPGSVQDPAKGTLGRDTRFGRDTRGVEVVPHGQAPKDDLPCNHHDVCYQTCCAEKLACDNAMFRDMQAVCQKAYPEATCPYLPNLAKCNTWRRERDNCYAWARRYRAGLAADKWKDDRFGDRQDEYCWPGKPETCP